MARFVSRCPQCGKFAEAKTGFFARKKIDCACGYTINVRTDRMASRVCPHCGNTVIFDQAKGADARCPVCGEPIEYHGGAVKGRGVSLQAVRCAASRFSCGEHVYLPGL